jgi:hypothetical protein
MNPQVIRFSFVVLAIGSFVGAALLGVKNAQAAAGLMSLAGYLLGVVTKGPGDTPPAASQPPQVTP